MLSVERLKELFEYNEFTGLFKALTKRCGPKSIGSINGSGYLQIMVDRKIYAAHRLVFLYMIGRWPLNQIDHINGKRSDNRWKNLREANKYINAQNIRKARKDSSSGVMGVTPVSGKNLKKPWQVKIRINDRQVYMGCYKTLSEAENIYLNAKRKYHEGCTI